MKKLLFILLFLIPMKGWATTYYVSTSGSNANSCATAQGTGASAKRHPGGDGSGLGGLACLAAGDRLIVQAGTYNTTTGDRISNAGIGTGYEQFASGTAAAPIIIECETHLACTLRPTGGALGDSLNMASQDAVVYIGSSRAYITVRHFVFDSGGRFNDVVLLEGAAGLVTDHIVISDNEITGGLYRNLAPNGTNSQILRNDLHDTYHGSNTGCDSGGIACGYLMYGHGDNLIVDGNHFHNAAVVSITTYNAGTPSTGIIIRNNEFDHNGLQRTGLDVQIYYCLACQFYNNIIHDTTDSALQIQNTSSNMDIYNNTIYNVQVGIRFENNAGGFGANRYDNNLIIGAAFMATLDNSGNTNTNGGKNIISGTGASHFVTPGTDFHLISASPARNNGTNLITVFNADKDGIGRPPTTAWDVGAYQYTTTTPPSNAAPVEDFVYSGFLEGNTGGINWLGPWINAGPNAGTITLEGAPAGMVGNAAMSQSASGTVLYYRQTQTLATLTVPMALSWQMRSTITNPNAFTSVAFGNAANPGLANGAVYLYGDGHIRACNGASTADLGTYNADQTYAVECELDAAGHSGQYRVRIDGGSFTSWLTMCETTATIDRLYIVDAATNAHTFWVDSIGSIPPSSGVSAGIFFPRIFTPRIFQTSVLH